MQRRSCTMEPRTPGFFLFLVQTKKKNFFFKIYLS